MMTVEQFTADYSAKIDEIFATMADHTADREMAIRSFWYPRTPDDAKVVSRDAALSGKSFADFFRWLKA